MRRRPRQAHASHGRRWRRAARVASSTVLEGGVGGDEEGVVAVVEGVDAKFTWTSSAEGVAGDGSACVAARDVVAAHGPAAGVDGGVDAAYGAAGSPGGAPHGAMREPVAQGRPSRMAGPPMAQQEMSGPITAPPDDRVGHHKAQTRELAAQGRSSRRAGPPMARQEMSGPVASTPARKTAPAGEELSPCARGCRGSRAHLRGARWHHVWSDRRADRRR